VSNRIVVTSLLAATALGGILATAPAMAAVISPVAVTASNTFPFFGEYKPENLINGSGLSGGLHDGTYTNMWMTDQTLQSATLLFDLGAAYELGGINIWNYNADFGMGYSLARSAKDFTVEISLDGVSFTELLADTLDKGTGLPLAAESFALDGEARYVRLNLLNNYGDQWTAVGLSEVNFTAVPEPASLALLAGGLGLLAGARRKRLTAGG
jgi:hypothetical protein